ncbi:hypothetical protein [Coralloluteibacterium stylophorae]|uniref:Uncharacterized protein n=1 Tax=Coralloluteibacterium stylophorae TaxID=1776034 RepID=A0AAP2C8S4_9GAMM|nr:hypothetical protein [Coralloluteibacterium stylophorae]MBS7456388.1 hypothetical protein [Coralloluteibacterium stylophorae]
MLKPNIGPGGRVLVMTVLALAAASWAVAEARAEPQGVPAAVATVAESAAAR